MLEDDPGKSGVVVDEVREAVLRGAETPDFFSARPTHELQTILRETETLPLDTLINRGKVEVDYGNRRIWRDSFWKGSFAGDTVLGWKERIQQGRLAGAAAETAGRYTGGSFWKRFDRIEGGAAIGYVVNYEIQLLPGKPVVRQLPYPDDIRKYFKAGDDVLLLKYTNDPYRLVYDTMKAIDSKTCIGVMHVGDFPRGIEVATFVMARHNYPFEKMSVPDHQLIFNGDHVRVPTPAEIAGTWDGHLIFLTRPDSSLLNRLNPVAFRLRFMTTGAGVEGRYRFGILSGATRVEFTNEFARLIGGTAFHDEIRMIDEDTMIGKWASPSSVLVQAPVLRQALEGYLEADQSRLAFYYLLKRASTR